MVLDNHPNSYIHTYHHRDADEYADGYADGYAHRNADQHTHPDWYTTFYPNLDTYANRNSRDLLSILAADLETLLPAGSSGSLGDPLGLLKSRGHPRNRKSSR